jgi:hypothetical protein
VPTHWSCAGRLLQRDVVEQLAKRPDEAGELTRDGGERLGSADAPAEVPVAAVKALVTAPGEPNGTDVYVGDARGASANAVTDEFLGDYVYAVATRTYGAAVWNDVRNAVDCSAVDAWRLSLEGSTPGTKPAPAKDCPAAFGNSDIYGGAYLDPTP